MSRSFAAAPNVDCTLKVPETLGRRGFSGCADLLVGLVFPSSAVLYYDYLITMDGRRKEMKWVLVGK